ncbi:hypothetical protein SETIT_4G197600v2 [Setaria italica]|uniref:Uncharacterized protein n=1 Tax=Setaria italica TaxID=4555 RepID=A0A368QW85_SETIT|nr:hypothetical protein SETIT_4G197600v2 [Setaria italica]
MSRRPTAQLRLLSLFLRATASGLLAPLLRRAPQPQCRRPPQPLAPLPLLDLVPPASPPTPPPPLSPAPVGGAQAGPDQLAKVPYAEPELASTSSELSLLARFVGDGGNDEDDGDKCEATACGGRRRVRGERSNLRFGTEGVPLLPVPPPPIAAASDHITETRGPRGENGGDEEGRRGWRRPGSRPAALLGSTPPRGYPSPRPAVSCRIAGPWAGAGAAAAGGLGLGTVGAGSAAGPGRGAWSGSAGSEPPLMDFFRALGFDRLGTLAVSSSSSFFSPPPPPPPSTHSTPLHSTPLSLSLSLPYVYVCMYVCTFHSH